VINALKQEASAHGDRLRVVPAGHIQSLREEIALFQEQNDLNDFQKWIVNDLYRFDMPSLAFPVQSIIIVAIPHPAYAKVEFVRRGRKYYFACLVMSDFDLTGKYIGDFLAQRGYHREDAPNLPMKRLAVKSGLAVYGRNNICYVEDMGSFLSFAAYYSDVPCDESEWMEVRMADNCARCRACLHHCPTGAIRDDRFLIDNERCLSYLNEGPGEFPEWLPLSVHHCVYDCLQCQIHCPMNKAYADHIVEGIGFDETETDILLSGVPFDKYGPAMKQKAKVLGLDQWPDGIPRNLQALFDLHA
jgi:epoxyqueuosine reductase